MGSWFPTMTAAEQGAAEGVHPMGTFRPRWEASAFTAPGASAPGQTEEEQA